MCLGNVWVSQSPTLYDPVSATPSMPATGDFSLVDIFIVKQSLVVNITANQLPIACYISDKHTILVYNNMHALLSLLAGTKTITNTKRPCVGLIFNPDVS